MQQYFYYGILRKSVVQFLDLFNNIRIGKYKNGEVQKYVEVPIRLAPKEKFFSWIHKRHEKRLPMMGANITSIDPAVSERGRNDKIKLKVGTEEYMRDIVPYNVGVEISIASLFMVEIDQILEQVLPFFSPYGMIRLSLPELGLEKNLKVRLGSVSPETSLDIGEDEYRKVVWNLSFVIDGFLLKPPFEGKEIHQVYHNLYDMDALEPGFQGDGYYETLSISGAKNDGETLYKYEILDEVPNDES